MKYNLKQIIGALIAFVLTFSFGLAQAAVDEPIAIPKQCVLKIGTGPKDKGFSNLFRDINYVCGEEVEICEVRTEGGTDNDTMLASKTIDLGMTTLDILQSLKNSDENIANLVGVLPLNVNLVHVLTKSSGYQIKHVTPGEVKYGFIKGDDKVTYETVRITKYSELKGQPIALVGSMKILARTTLRSVFGDNVIDAKDDDEAKNMVMSGTARAMATISGYPNGVVKTLTTNSGLALVNYDQTPIPPYIAVKKNYTNMGVIGATFLGTQSLLIARPFDPTGANGQNLSKLQSCIIRNLKRLKEGGPDWKIQPQPGWNEIKSNATFGWPQYTPAASARK